MDHNLNRMSMSKGLYRGANGLTLRIEPWSSMANGWSGLGADAILTLLKRNTVTNM
jgi:hypothetical protein